MQSNESLDDIFTHAYYVPRQFPFRFMSAMCLNLDDIKFYVFFFILQIT